MAFGFLWLTIGKFFYGLLVWPLFLSSSSPSSPLRLEEPKEEVSLLVAPSSQEPVVVKTDSGEIVLLEKLSPSGKSRALSQIMDRGDCKSGPAFALTPEQVRTTSIDCGSSKNRCTHEVSDCLTAALSGTIVLLGIRVVSKCMHVSTHTVACPMCIFVAGHPGMDPAKA
jgi:hypothetical protein